VGAVTKLLAERRSCLLRFRLPTAHGEAGLVVKSREPRHVGPTSKVSQVPWAHAVCTHGA